MLGSIQAQTIALSPSYVHPAAIASSPLKLPPETLLARGVRRLAEVQENLDAAIRLLGYYEAEPELAHAYASCGHLKARQCDVDGTREYFRTSLEICDLREVRHCAGTRPYAQHLHRCKLREVPQKRALLIPVGEGHRWRLEMGSFGRVNHGSQGG